MIIMISQLLFVLVTSLMFPATHGIYADQGPMHEALAGLMDSQSHLRTVTISSPKMNPKTCTWNMQGWGLGEYGRHYVIVYMRSDNCTKYTEDFWSGTFPCVLTKGSDRTTCQGPVPAGTDEAIWDVSSGGAEPPARWTGSFRAAPQSLPGSSTPFVKKLNCENLTGLTVARAAQRTGVYVGKGEVSCRSTKTQFYLTVKGPGVHGWLRVHATDVNREVAFTTKNVSWESGFDNRGRLVVSMAGRMVHYTKRLLSGGRLKLEGKMRVLVYGVEVGEPRLCPVTSISGACSVMNSLSESELETLGNVTGFNVFLWHPFGTAVSMYGYVLGTKGVISATYSASILDMNDMVWMELPLGDDFTVCTPRLYSISDCSGLPIGAPRLGPYEHENAVRYTFS